MVNFKTIISSVSAPTQMSTDYGSPLFLKFSIHKPYCLTKLFLFMEFFKKLLSKTIAKYCEFMFLK